MTGCFGPAGCCCCCCCCCCSSMLLRACLCLGDVKKNSELNSYVELEKKLSKRSPLLLSLASLVHLSMR